MSIPQRTHTQKHRFPTSLTLARKGESFAKLRGLPWRERVAWALRILADKVDRRTSYTLSGRMHPSVATQSDWWDALTYGMAATQLYLSELAQDRAVGVRTRAGEHLDTRNTPKDDEGTHEPV